MPESPIPKSCGADECRFEGRTAVLRLGEVTYRLTGVTPAVVTYLRIPIRAERGSKLHLDRVDLASSRGRKKFAHVAAARLGADPETIESHLVAIVSILEEHAREERVHQERPVFAAAVPFTPEARERAVSVLSRPDLLVVLERDLAALGYVGEAPAKKLALLVAVSRKLPSPLAAILRSSSGSGKSALLDLVARVTPPEDVVFLSELTPQALYYLEKDALKHKLLVVDERSGSERADYPIRTLLSRQTLTLAVTVPDGATGRRRTRLVEVQGPVAYLESTTAPNLNPENANRVLEIFLDESPEQTRRIQEAQRSRRTALKGEDPSLVDRLRDLQRSLEPGAVEIPFAHRLAFPAELPRHRRDHEKFLRLIEASTLLHQHQRERRSGRFVAVPADYRIAYELALPILGRGSETLSPAARDLLRALRDLELLEFTRRDVSRRFGWSPVRVWRTVQELLRADFVSRLPAGPDRRHRYRVLEFFEEGGIATRLLPPSEIS